MENAVFFDSLDEKFNSLRHKNLNDNAKRVIGAYVSIFILMMKELYDLNDFDWSFENVFAKLREKYSVGLCPESYYRILRDSGFECDVITTNYTDLVEKETGRPTIYLHGKLTWFEDRYDLSVYNCLEEKDYEHLLQIDTENRIIPFILIPSGVKPLICTKQIEQFSKFINSLDKNHELCTIGYKFNSEDNHINSIIAEWLRKPNHRLVCFNFDGEADFTNFEWARSLTNNTFEYSEKEFYTKMKKEYKIINVIINKKNSRKAFKAYLNILQKG